MTESIQLKLSLTLSLAILLVALVAGIFSFVSALHEAHELQDDVLRQVAALIGLQTVPLNLSVPQDGAKGRSEESRVLVQRLVDDGNANARPNRKALSLPNHLPDGLQTLEANGESYRVLVKTMASGERLAFAQESEFRDEIARDSALRTVMPFLLLVPILLLIVADLVRNMFRPIAAISEEIDQRAEQELHPVPENHLPIEVRPFVVAINRLLGRVAQSVQSQRRFVANAAHELRSPLTALSLQAERLARAQMSAPAQERLATLRLGIERARAMLDQLLTLARAQSFSEPPKSPASIQAVYRRVLEDLMPLAEAKHIDLGVDGESDAQVLVSELDLIAVVQNLVDNAVRYTPEGGKVDLSVGMKGGRAVLRVLDTGPGISAPERERVFDPFYRPLGNDQVGSGLGLSIVKTIADRIGATIDLQFGDQEKRTGLCISVVIPDAIRRDH